MKPNEFWNATYREAKMFVESRALYLKNRNKEIITIADAFGNKIIKALSWKNPKNRSLIKDVFKDMFSEELEPNKIQTPEEQIRILRSMKGK